MKTEDLYQRGIEYLEQHEWDAAEQMACELEKIRTQEAHSFAEYLYTEADLGRREQNHDYLMDSLIHQHLEEAH